MAQSAQGSEGRTAPGASLAQKAKLLHLARIFHDLTDEEHGLAMPAIVEELAAVGVSAERKTLYRDIKTLQDFGLDIVKLPRRPVEYALARRSFSAAELQLMIDAVSSSRFLTRELADDLVRRIKRIGSRRQAEELFGAVHVDGRIKTQNESVYRNVDVIQRAIHTRRKVSFRYFEYGVDLKEHLRRDGAAYERTPVALLYGDGSYYLVAYSDEHEGVANFRVDRMRDISVLDEPATRNKAIAQFDAETYQSRLFGMYNAEQSEHVALLVREDAMNAIVDRFGRSIHCSRAADAPGPGRWARVSIRVVVSQTFFGWVSQFAGSVVIATPRVAKRYHDYLKDLLGSYQDYESEPGESAAEGRSC